MKRTSMRRSTKGLKRSKGIARTKPVNAVSANRKAANAERREMLRGHLMDHCEFKRAGGPGDCLGALHGHEVIPRGRGGSITDPDNIRTVCDGHNTAISQDVETMRWAYANGFLRHGWEGKQG